MCNCIYLTKRKNKLIINDKIKGNKVYNDGNIKLKKSYTTVNVK